MLKQQKAIEILECMRGELKRLVEDQNALPASPAFLKWQFDTETAIRSIFPDKQRHLQRFGSIAFRLSFPYHPPRLGETAEQRLRRASAPRRIFVEGMQEADAILHSMTEEVRKYWTEDGTSLNPQGAQPTPKHDSSTVTKIADPSAVFVVHGRNSALREAMFTFLTAIRLHPLEWSEARAATGEASPYIGDILDQAFSMAQAVVVLMTPDDEAWLKEEFRKQDDPQHETTLTGQSRPNVLFEAGMAMGREPKRTVLVEVGKLRPFSDVVGRHTVRLDNSTEQRQELAQRLKTAGCPVNLEGTRWHTVGSFELNATAKPEPTAPQHADASIEAKRNAAAWAIGSQVSRADTLIEAAKSALKGPRAEKLDPTALKTLMQFFDKANNLSANEIGKHLQLVERSAADYQIDQLLERRFIQRSHTEPKGWAPLYKITSAGRAFIMKNRAGG